MSNLNDEDTRIRDTIDRHAIYMRDVYYPTWDRTQLAKADWYADRSDTHLDAYCLERELLYNAETRQDTMRRGAWYL